MSNLWAIVDDESTIYDGGETLMREYWKNLDDYLSGVQIVGDIKLIEIHGVKR